MLDRFNASFFLGLGQYLQQLIDHASGDRYSFIDCVISARIHLEFLYTSKHSTRPLLSLKTSESAGLSLLLILDKLSEKLRQKTEYSADVIESTDSELLKKAVSEFKIVLEAELARAFTYVVSQVGILAVDSLIASADDVFAGYKDRVPEGAKNDTKEAGRSIAFNLPTAAGFHIARATEAVLLKYLAAFGQTITKEGNNILVVPRVT